MWVHWSKNWRVSSCKGVDHVDHTEFGGKYSKDVAGESHNTVEPLVYVDGTGHRANV